LNFANCLIIDKVKEENELEVRIHSIYNWIDLVLSTHQNPNELILIADTHEIAGYNDKHPNAPLKILDHRIIKFRDFPIGRWTEHVFLIPLLRTAAIRLSENGLLERIIEKWVDLSNVRPPPLESDPVVLTFDHVGVAFKICAGFIILSLLTFIIEFIVSCFLVN